MNQDPFIYVSPVIATASCTIAKIVPQVTSLEIFKVATVKINYFDEDNVLIPPYLYNLIEEIELTKEEYAKWGADDTDLIEIILTKLNLTPIPAPTPPSDDPNSIVDIPEDDIS